ncbi:MAG: transketolase [Ignavibacteriae bacterium]|nr:transketolase [Ignavibacteriota bacterium]MCB9242590.1 transketolase [Ignavibacteriales bacterium]
MSKNPQLTSIDDLNEMARQIRRDIINELNIAQTGHSGGPLGMADIFTALYFNIMNVDNENPEMGERDFLFLSIGHIAPVWYPTLARRGYIPLEELKTLRQINGRLQGHPAPAKTHGVPGVEIASGSLGQGLSIAVGAALGLRLDGKSNHVYCICGDGELQEGQIWEALMTAAHHKCDNLTMIIDRNHCQIDNRTENVMEIEPLADKLRAFNWEVFEMDGHDMQAILDTIKAAKDFKGKPSVIIANTYMGKGVSFMEDKYQWHGVPPSHEQAEQALSELEPTKYGDFV